MAPVAHADLSPIAIFIALIFALIKYLVDKSKEPVAPAPKRSAAEEERERTRRFLEALGTPKADEPLRRGTPPPLHPRSAPHPIREKPVPPIVAGGPVDWSKPRGKRPQAPPAPKRQRHVAPEALPTVPELATPEMREFKTVSSEVQAVGPEWNAMEQPHVRRETAVMEELRGLLGSPQALRTAFLLREILGPPRGLPSGSGNPSLPSL